MNRKLLARTSRDHGPIAPPAPDTLNESEPLELTFEGVYDHDRRAVVDTLFVGYYSETSRLAAVRAATIVAVHRLPGDFRRDLEQEAKLEIWRKRSTYDARRGSWRTYSEQVVANRMTSLLRSMHSTRSGQFREEPLHDRLGLPAASDNIELRISRAGVYRAIGRLRVAFAAAGFANPQGRP